MGLRGKPGPRSKSAGRLVAWCLLGAGLALQLSCTGPSARLLDRPVAPSEIERILGTSSEVTERTRRFLREEGLSVTQRRDPDAAIAALVRRYGPDPAGIHRLALAELCLDRAEGLVRQAPEAALGRYLDALSLTGDAALAAVGTEGESHGQSIYNKAAEQVARLVHRRGGGPLTAPGVLATYTLGVAEGPQYPSLSDLDLVVPADWLETSGLDMATVATGGFGAPMIGHRAQTPERLRRHPTMPSAGYSLPLNARVRFAGSRATLCLQDLMVVGGAEVDGRRVPLAGDFTAALSFYYFARKREARRILATLRPANFRSLTGLYSVEPHREDKIPLIIVHGLLSSGEAWIPFVNLVRADPVVRERYQILLFNYPSGNPVEENAAELREALARYRDVHDPDRSNPRMRRMVVLGHSMGGILTNMQIRDSGSRLERAYLARDLDEFDLRSEARSELARLYRFEANPDIGRAVFIAAPHRGSDFAINPIGQIGAWLIRLPFDLTDSVLGELALVDAVTDVAQDLVERPLNSVTSLRPDNPLLEATLALPVEDGVRTHSIIARKDPSEPLLESSDGVVPYVSAHLDRVASELVVNGATHRSVVQDPACVLEVWRLLRIHAGVRR